MFFRSKKFKRKNISHWFFTRKGGVSKGIYKSLNLGIGSKDNKANIIKNINIIKKKTNLKKIYTVKQIHSNKILELTKNYKNQRLSCADGIFTNKSDIGIGILTADCAPILFVDNNSEYICCIHSGWKGAYKNIIMKAVACYKRKNIAAINIMAVVGPCIGFNSYEVSKDFKRKIYSKFKNSRPCFKKKNKKIYFNLRKFIIQRLVDSGLKLENISHINKDTYMLKQFFFSFRLSTHKNELDYGRNLSIITKK